MKTAEAPDRDLVASYMQCFTEGLATTAVLGDLGAFCGDQRAVMPLDMTGRSDPYAAAVALGRRQVWNHILAMLTMPTSTAWQLIEHNRQMRKSANG